MDVVFQKKTAGVSWAAASVNRRDIWPSRSAAEEKFRSNKAFQKWDHRVLEKYLKYGLRELPTELYPEIPSDSQDTPVTLQTTKAQEQYNYIRPTYHDDRYLLQENELWQDFSPEDLEDEPDPGSFARAENKVFFRKLPEVRPSVLYMYGTESEVSTPEGRKARMDITGTGSGGSGGAAAKGRVKEVGIECGHLVPFERTTDSADACVEFLSEELGRWDREDQNRRQRWERLSRRERVDINDLWREKLGAKKKEGKL